MPQVKLKYCHYRFYDQFDISFHAQTIDKKLKYLIDPFAIQFSNKKTADITLCKSTAEIRQSENRNYRGKYKGIKWAVGIAREKRNGASGISFYSACSVTCSIPWATSYWRT